MVKSYQEEIKEMSPEDAANARIIHGTVSSQTCRSCGRDLPLNDHWYNRDRTRKSGYKVVCVECMAKKRQEKQDRRIISASQKMDLDLLKIFDAALAGYKGGVPHVARFAEAILKATGGIDGYIQHLMSSRLMAKPGTAIRLRYDQLLYSFILKSSEMGAAKMPTEMMGEQECLDELENVYEEEVARRVQLRLLHGSNKQVKLEETPIEPPLAKAE